MAQIAVNTRNLLSPVTGVQRYTLELLPFFEGRVDLIAPRRALSGISGHVWEQLVLPLRLLNRRLFSPSNTGPLWVRDQVVTIHDAATFDHPEWFDPKFAVWYRLLLPVLVRRVRRVITDSEFSRQRLAAACRYPAERILVAPPGVNARFKPALPSQVLKLHQELGLPERYFLFVGSIDPRKNLAALLAAWQLVHPLIPDACLVLVGTRGSAFQMVRLPQGLPRVLHLGYLEDGCLPVLYSGALACLQPSLYEGFGLTVLEAMACHTPVLASKIPALLELTAGNAVLVDPLDVSDIGAGIHRLAVEAYLRKELAEGGAARASNFRWENAAALIWQALSEG